MSKRFIIMERTDYDDRVHHEFVMETTHKAVKAFRTLYGEQPQYVLFEQVACIDPTGSCAGSDDASGETEV